MKTRSFVDAVTVSVRAGNGGNGCVSFRREKYVPMGGPDGGDGGRGGHVTLVGNRDENSLVRLYFAPHLRAGHGGHGRGKQMYGANGRDLRVSVPCGTEVWDAERTVLLGDITQHGQELLVARGGRGGRGNVHWKSSTHQAPREHTDGDVTEDIALHLELKLMADVGLVGFPNAGKSSLLAAISDAHPRIAPYPFTTLNPIIGTVMYSDYARLTVADIPGLIDGAHDGIGLGHAFLRHVERARCLAYVIDMAGSEGRDPVEDYRHLREELAFHRKDLARRPSLVVANKMDLPDAAARLAEFKAATRKRVLPVSALADEGIATLKTELRKLWVKAGGGPAAGG